MDNVSRKFRAIGTGFVLSACVSSPVLADDIEIYTDSNGAAPTAQPNVLFIMDSSDSMRDFPDASVPTTAPYDKNTTYTDNGFDASSFYYKSNGVAPVTHDANETFLQANFYCNHALVNYLTGTLFSETQVDTSYLPWEFTAKVEVKGTGYGEARDIYVYTHHNGNTLGNPTDDGYIYQDDADPSADPATPTLSTVTGATAASTTVTSGRIDFPTIETIYDMFTEITIAPTNGGDTREVTIVWKYDLKTPTDPSDDFLFLTQTFSDIEVGYGPLITEGFYSGQIAQYRDQGGTRNDGWFTPDTNTAAERSNPVECLQDQGIHGGPTNTTTDTHIKNGNNGDAFHSAADATLIDSLWQDASANFYTIFHPNYINYLLDAPTATTNTSLFDTLKNAVQIIVNSASNIKIGLMQYDKKLNSSSAISNDGVCPDENGDGVCSSPEAYGDVSDIVDIAHASGAVGGEGGSVQYPAASVNESRGDFSSRLRTMAANGDAPISETYFEALKYFGGDEVFYGDTANPSNQTGTTDAIGGTRYYDSPIDENCHKNYIILLSGGFSSYDYLDSTKRSSLYGFDVNSCGNTGGVDDYDPSNSNRNANDSDGSTNDNCLDELAGWAYTQDVARRDETGPFTTNDPDFAEHAGTQNITTYTVGFAFPDPVDPANLTAEEQARTDAEQLLRDAAEKGGGEFVEAANEAELVQVLNSLIANILKVNSTFSSPAVSVNAFNRSTHLNDLYFTLFKPDDGEHWVGNLKKYKLLFDADGVPFVADKNADSAVDAASGFFAETSESYWSASIDGDEAGEGGAANLIGNTEQDGSIEPRKVYTITGTYTNGSNRTDGVYTADVPSLLDSDNLLRKTNAFVSAAEWDALFGISGHVEEITGTPYRETLIDWMNGRDVLDEVSGSDSRRQMGDPLHAEPALVQYGELTGVDVDNDGLDDPDLVSFVATNDGYLHAFSTRDRSPNDSPSDTGGKELWAFVPQEMLPFMDSLFENDGTDGKMYGIDGSVVAWINDTGDVGITEASPSTSRTFLEDDHVFIYFGMRRGMQNGTAGDGATDIGQDRNYIYALDVTDRDAPEFKWMIEAGTGTYDELGQTWSTINVEKIKVNGEARHVLIFGGGYDPTVQDSATQRTVDTQGRALYIVDADTGERLWSAGPGNADVAQMDHDLEIAEMVYSIPSRVKPLDINGDGFIDRIYFGDMGGQLFRFDIALSTDATVAASSGLYDELASELVTGGRIADFAVDTSTTENRRFYYPPDVAFIVEEGQGAYLSILAASGYRAHPLQTDTHDRIYMIRDKDIYDPPVDGLGNISYTTVTEADLYDATDNLVAEGTAGDSATVGSRAEALEQLAGAQGWYINLNEPVDNSWVGEKALSEPLIFSNTAIVTTYLPATAGYASGNLCEPNAGTAGIFFLNIADATPTYTSSDDLGTRSDRRQLLQRGGIPPTPSVVITSDSKPTLCVGTECDEADANLNITKTYWYEIENSATITP